MVKYYWRVYKKQIVGHWWNDFIDYLCWLLCQTKVDQSGPLFPLKENGSPYSFKDMSIIHRRMKNES
jgi:hypothetical protein